MTIRAALPEDAQALAVIHAACFEVAWSQETIGDFVQAASVTIIGNPAKGFLIVRHVLDEAEIITLAINPAAQKQGLAHALLGHKLAELGNQGVSHIFLEVAIDNVAALQLYRTLGFDQTGLRKDYYQRKSGHMVDALMLSRVLGGATIVAHS